MNKIETPAIFLFASAPRGGKSFFIRYLIYGLSKIGRFNHGLVFCPTAFNGDYDFMPKNYIETRWNPERLEKFMDKQEKLVEEMGDNAPEAFVILDDCLGTANFNDKIFLKLLSSYRHFKISVFIGTQNIYRVSTTCRECAKYVFIFKQSTKRSFEALFDTYGQSGFENLAEFKKKLNDNTKDRHVLMYDLDAPNEIDKKFVRVKAKAVPKFKLQF